MDFLIERTYVMQCAHHLPEAPAGHPCGRVHGHTYAITVCVAGPIDKGGWVMDFGELDAIVEPAIAKLDHTDLNDRFDNPTSEILAMHILEHTVRGLGEGRRRCASVRVVENDRSCVEARPAGGD